MFSKQQEFDNYGRDHPDGGKQARYSARVIAEIKGKPLPPPERDRRFPQEGYYRRQLENQYTQTLKKERMKQSIEELPAQEAGQAPEGIQSTKDYGVFKLLATNRPVDKAHVRKLMTAIRKKNLLHLNPIVVNGDLEVIDGQHRLEAAKQLGVSIFYAQDVAVTQDDIAGMNSNKKNWGVMDYIHFYAAQQTPGYPELVRFFAEYPTMPPVALMNLSTATGKMSREYKEGVVDISGMDTARTILQYQKDFAPHLQFYNTAKFIDALSFIVRTGLYDHGHMVRKLEANPGALIPCATVKGYIESLERLYNKNVREQNIIIFLKRR